MIKKIKIEQLQVGVYIHDFNYRSSDQKIFINNSQIKSEKAIKILQSWGVKEVYIDTEKGLNELPLQRSSKGSPHPELLEKTKKTNSSVKNNRVPLKEELHQAKAIRKEAVDLLEQANHALQNGEQIDVDNAYALVNKMEESVARNKDALLLLTRIRQKDEYTLMHSISVSSLALAFCSQKGHPHQFTIKLAMGALFHDIGKTLIPNDILNKPGKLTESEFDVVKKHAEYSADLLSKTQDFPPEVFDISLHHHERCDGSGYPYKLVGQEISPASRLVSICDVFDALTSDRCYKKGIDRVSALKILYDQCKSSLDQEVTYEFIKFIGVYPVGTFVRLENGLSGVVVESGDVLLQPVVRVFYDENTKKSIPVQEIDLQAKGLNIKNYENLKKWNGEKIQLFRKKKNELSPLF